MSPPRDEKSRCTFYPVLTALGIGLVILAWHFSSLVTCNNNSSNTAWLSVLDGAGSVSSAGSVSALSTVARQTRRAPPPADEPTPTSLIKLVEAYRKKFSGPQPTGADCRKDSNYVYVHWYTLSGMGNRLPSSITAAAIALMTGRRLILPTLSKQFFSPTIPVCYHDPGFGGNDAENYGAPTDFPQAGSECVGCV